MGDFINVRSYACQNMLTEDEIGLLQMAIQEVMRPWELTKEAGTFVLVGQKRGQRAQEILRFNLCNGKKAEEDSEKTYQLYGCTSDRAVETAIDELLDYPRKKLSDDYGPISDNFGQLLSQYYYCGQPETYAIIMNTMNGRFLASTSVNGRSKAPTGEHDLINSILLGTAVALAEFSPSDTIMQESYQRVKQHCNKDQVADRVADVIHSYITENQIALNQFRVFFK